MFVFKFTGLSSAKLKKIIENIFVGSEIGRNFDEKHSPQAMNEKEEADGSSFKDVIEESLGNMKEPVFNSIVKRIFYAFEDLDCYMSLKILFLHSHVNYFS